MFSFHNYSFPSLFIYISSIFSLSWSSVAKVLLSTGKIYCVDVTGFFLDKVDKSSIDWFDEGHLQVS